MKCQSESCGKEFAADDSGFRDAGDKGLVMDCPHCGARHVECGRSRLPDGQVIIQFRLDPEGTGYDHGNG